MQFDTVVIGAGVIGLAVAAAAAARGQAVLVLEAGPAIGHATSARNSEIIHAGLYYPKDSLKHRLCIAGRHLLYDRLKAAHLPYNRCGKLIVATTPDEEATLARLLAQGRENGVEGLKLISGSDARSREPEVKATAALWSPETGIFDSHSFLQHLAVQVETDGGIIALNTPFAGATPLANGFRLHIGGQDPVSVRTRQLVNASGLWAPELARKIEGLEQAHVPTQWLAKGCYFRLSGRAPFSHLIYPVPEPGGLGIHATLDMTGAVRFGPDVDWLPEGTGPDALSYDVPPSRRDTFARAIARYWPGLPVERLDPDYSGVRPKLRGPGGGFFDFAIQGPQTHGLEGLINLFGMESPGLTAALAIGGAVAKQVS